MGTEERGGGELALIDWLAATLPPPPPGEVWIGDDAAVLVVPADVPGRPATGESRAAGEPPPPAGAPPPPPAGAPRLLFAADLVVAGVHFDLTLTTCADAGWKVLASNVSDVAAMGGRPWRCVVSIAGGSAEQLTGISAGLAEAAEHWACPLVGGDLSAGEQLVVSVAILGLATGAPVLRSGATPGDALFVTGPLGAAAAGLRLLRADRHATGTLVDAHRRPLARVEEGVAAATAGATAMIDVSDGLGLDLHRLALASGVGVELDAVPAAPGASEAEALGGGEDYELIVACPEPDRLAAAFAGAGLRAPLLIGRCVADPSRRVLSGSKLDPAGWEHHFA